MSHLYTPNARFDVIGFDVGGVVTRSDARKTATWLDNETHYLETPCNPGFLSSLGRLMTGGVSPANIHFVSKCRPATAERTRIFLEHIGVHSGDYAIPPDNVHFTETRDGKAPIVRRLEIDRFMDDRAEVLSHMHGIVPDLYAFCPEPDELAEYGWEGPDLRVVHSWDEAVDLMLAEPPILR
jgi:hypothetical protein